MNDSESNEKNYDKILLLYSGGLEYIRIPYL